MYKKITQVCTNTFIARACTKKADWCTKPMHTCTNTHTNMHLNSMHSHFHTRQWLYNVLAIYGGIVSGYRNFYFLKNIFVLLHNSAGKVRMPTQEGPKRNRQQNKWQFWNTNIWKFESIILILNMNWFILESYDKIV